MTDVDLDTLQAELVELGDRHGVRIAALVMTEGVPDRTGHVRVGFHLAGHSRVIDLLGPYLSAALRAFSGDMGRRP